MVNISLTPELEDLVRDKVTSGLYNNASEVVRDALRLLVQRDEMGRLYEDWLTAEVEVGLEQLDRGEGRPYDMGALVAKVQAEAISAPDSAD